MEVFWETTRETRESRASAPTYRPKGAGEEPMTRTKEERVTYRGPP